MTTNEIDLIKSIKVMLKRGDTAQIKELFLKLHPADIAELLAEIQNSSQKHLFKLIDYQKAAEVLDELEPEIQIDIINCLPEGKKEKVIREMSIDEIVDLLQVLPENKVEKVLEKLSIDELENVKGLLLLSHDSAGGIMTTEYVYIPQDTTVQEAIKMVRKFGRHAETIYYLYIVDENHKLVGVLSLRELISAQRNLLVKDIMHKKVVTVNVDDDQEIAVKTIDKYSLLAVPVIDTNERLMGIITVDDALEVLKEETTEDIHRMAGITAEEESVLTSSPIKAFRKRIPWLLVCLIGDLLAGNVIKGYSSALEAVIALAFFIPVLMDTGGNVGTQSLALAVRGLATEQLTRDNIIRNLIHETIAGLIVGTVCGGLFAIVAFFWQGNPYIGITVGVAMVIGLALSALIGMLIPVMLNLFHIDPAIASGPLITTIVDIITLAVYFRAATFFLKELVM